MISFIIIGKNIENTIKLCLDSVFQFVKVNQLKRYEIIYVDSESKDKSIEIAEYYPIRIFKIEGNVNAAIGRNVGAKNSNGDICFFLDGDMELLPDFFSSIFNENASLLYPFIRGMHIHMYYNQNNEHIYTISEYLSEKPSYSPVSGGLMVVEKKLWNDLNGMDVHLIRNQDLDFGLRMSKKGIPILIMNKYFVKHHTASYSQKDRLKYFLTSKALLSPGVLMRKHLFNYDYLKLYYQNYVFCLLLIISTLFCFINLKISAITIIIYLVIHFLRTLKSIKKEHLFVNDLIFKILYNIYILFGLFFYFPGNPTYKILKIK